MSTFLKIILLLALTALSAQPSIRAQAQPRFVYEHLTERDGLLHAEVVAIRQDRAGLMWFGTLAGLWCYDGSRFRYFTHDFADTASLHGSAVRNFWEDAEGDIWAMFPDGLSRLHRRTDHFAFVPTEPGKNFSSASPPDAQGRMWITWRDQQGKTTLTLTELRTGRPIFQPDCFPDEQPFPPNPHIVGLLPDGQIWLSDGPHLYGVQTSTSGWSGPVERHSFPPLDQKVRCDFFRDADGSDWVWTPDGRIFFRKKGAARFQHFAAADALLALLGGGMTGHRHIFQDAEGYVWFCAHVGILLVSARTGACHILRHLPGEPQSLPNNRMLSFFQDKTGVVWVGHDFGISKVRRQPAVFEVMRPHPLAEAAPQQGNKVYGVCEGRDGTLWVGAPDVGLVARQPLTGQQRAYPIRPALAGAGTVLGVLETRDGSVWAGTRRQGLWRLHPQQERWAQVCGPDPAHCWRMHVIRSLLETPDGRIWIARLHGVSVLDPRSGQLAHYDMPDPPPNCMGGQHVFGLCQDAGGTVWAGAADCNLYEFPADGSPMRAHRFPSAASLLSIHFNPDSNVLWLGTQGDGLARFDLKTRTFDQFYSYPQGLTGNMVYGILPDGEGNFWLSTNNGVFRFSPVSRVFVRYGQEDGLPDNDLYTIAYHRGASGKLYFGCLSGLIAFDPAELRRLGKTARQQQRPALVFTAVEVAGQPQREFLHTPGPTGTLVLPPGQQGLRLRFALLDYVFPDKKLYRWRLRGLNADWNLPQPVGEAFYPHLPRGAYFFQVETLDASGQPLGDALEIRVEVRAFFWHREEFWACVVGLLLAAGGWFFVQYRAALTRAAHEARSEALRAQMNPHFLYNTLNTAAAFVATRERREGVEFLAQASGLFRAALEASSQACVSLRDEVFFLKNYVALQQQRHPGKFDFEVEIAPELDLDAVQLPALLLQPLLENAIEHGLVPSGKTHVISSLGHSALGRLSLRFWQSGDQLLAEVSDNGIGREASATLRARFHALGHRSRGLALLRERLRLLGALHRKPHNLDIQDLRDPDGRAAGTQATLRLPLGA